MIAGIFHEGSGLGDQLFRYITVRTLAEKKGFDFGVIGRKNFKGDEFIRINMGKETGKLGVSYFDVSGANPGYPKIPELAMGNWIEKDVRDEFGNDIRSFDPEINFVEDDTIIDGSFEDSKYWGHNLDNISKWLAVEPLNVPDDLCVIGFRGGEYASQPDLFLPREYYYEATLKIIEQNPRVNFQVHTDDSKLATDFFKEGILSPHFQIVGNTQISHSKHTNMGFNWRSARYAKYAIIPNSAFFILPRLLKHHEDPTSITIAPRYWARRNTKVWARPACYYKQFTYI